MTDRLISRLDAESDLLAAAAYIAESVKSADGRADAVAAIVPVYLARGDVDTAAVLADMAYDSFARDRLLTRVAEKCADLGDDDYALQLVEAIEDANLRIQAYERIGTLKARSGQIERAKEIAKNIADSDAIIAAIAVRHAGDGDLDAAREMLKQINFSPFRAQALIEIAAAALYAGEAEKAAENLLLAEAAAGDLDHADERIRALIDVGHLWVDADRREAAFGALGKARCEAEEIFSSHRDTSLAAIAVEFLRAGSLEFAEQTLDLISDKVQIASTLLGYSREFWAQGETDEAVNALEDAYVMLKGQKDNEIVDRHVRYALLTSIASQFAGFGRGERAIEIAESIDIDGERAEALSKVAQVFTARGEDKLAVSALRAIKHDSDRTIALINIADASSQTHQAIEVLSEAEELADAVPQVVRRAAANNAIAKRFAFYGNPERALAIAEKNLAVIATIRDESVRAGSLAEMAMLFDDENLPITPEIKTALAALLFVTSPRT